jgi:Ca2+-binding RTX toxin-like protein
MTTFIGTNANDAVQTSPNNANDVYYMLDGDDYVNSQFAGLNYLDGGRGNDLLSLADGALAGQSGVISGGLGGDFIVGGQLGDNLYGDDGNDIITGGRVSNFGAAGGVEFIDDTNYASGGDFIEGGRGQDALYGLDGGDYIFGGDGSDSGTITFTTTGTGIKPSVKGGLFGGAGADYLDGADGSDYLDGGADADILIGGRGSDDMYGGAGIDFIFADSGMDTAYGGADADSIFGTGDVLTAHGDAGDDVIGGSGYNDFLHGGADGDLLWGYLGNDQLFGGTGIDRLSGYTGNDVFNGGSGLDYFIMNYDVQSASYDNIADFVDGVDFLQLPTYAQGFTTFTNAAFGCTVSIALGGSSYNVYVSGVSAAQIADQVYYFGV